LVYCSVTFDSGISGFKEVNVDIVHGDIMNLLKLKINMKCFWRKSILSLAETFRIETRTTSIKGGVLPPKPALQVVKP
jgi:hypothetical protein